MGPIPVLHLIDSLAVGGAERVAVNIANALPPEEFETHLCATRADGPLRQMLAPHVRFLSLRRAGRYDLSAFRKLTDYLQAHHIRLIHAHSTSLFIACLAAMRLRAHPVVLWHDHFGRYALEERPVLLYRPFVQRMAAVISVNQELSAWVIDRLRIPAERVRYIPNFARVPETALHGDSQRQGNTLICVANLRPEKDLLTLIWAMSRVIRSVPEARLLLVGAPIDPAYARRVEEEIARLHLNQAISLLGQRLDVADLLAQSDIGVLTSASEGLPVALLEYGAAGMPVVATRTGQCAEVLDEGRAGVLVEVGAIEALAEALIGLLKSPERRTELADRLHQRIQNTYSAEAVIQKISEIYYGVL